MNEQKDVVLEFDDVSIGFDKKKNIVENFSTKIYKGDFISIIGQNGSGKSTILKSIFGLSILNSGWIYFKEKNIKSIKSKELAKKIAYVPQITNFPTDVTLFEFVMMGRFPYGNVLTSDKQKDEQIVLESIRSVNLEGLENEYINNLSGGQQQRALIALTLAQDTDTIILDEPTNHLDIKMQLEIMTILKKLNNNHNKTIIIVIHDINHALKFSNKIIIMKNGRIIIQGETSKVINEDIIKKSFDVNAVVDENDGKKIIVDYTL